MPTWGGPWGGVWGPTTLVPATPFAEVVFVLEYGAIDVDPDEYAALMLQHLPKGRMWINFDETIHGLARGLAYTFARYDRRVRDLLLEFDTQTMQEHLDTWEDALDLSPADDATLEERRALVDVTLRRTENASLDTMLSIATELGYPSATLTHEYQPFRVGQSRIGDRIGGYVGGWLYTWRFTANANSDLNAVLITAMRRLARGHTTWYFDFPGQATVVRGPGNYVLGEID